MVSFENFVKSMPSSLSELKVTPSFCFSFKIPDDLTATNKYDPSISRIFESSGFMLLRPTVRREERVQRLQRRRDVRHGRGTAAGGLESFSI